MTVGAVDNFQRGLPKFYWKKFNKKGNIDWKGFKYSENILILGKIWGKPDPLKTLKSARFEILLAKIIMTCQ